MPTLLFRGSLTLLTVGITVSGLLLWLSSDRLYFIVTMAHALTLTQSWVYVPLYGDRTIMSNGFGLSWSISTEAFFYVCYALWLARPIAYLKRHNAVIALALISLAAICVLLGAHSFRDTLNDTALRLVGPPAADGPYSFVTWLTYFSPYVRIFEFLVGCLTAQLFLIDSEGDRPTEPSRPLLILAF